MAMSAESPERLPHISVRETLNDHEERITRNERWRLLLKGAIVGLALATGSEQAISTLLQLV